MTDKISIASEFGSLAALVDLPTGATTFPVVVLLHGFTGWKEEEHLASLAKRLCANGIGVVRFDAPGSGESDGTFAETYRLTNYMEASRAVLDFARMEFGVVQRSLGLWGHSMGGFVALAHASHFAGVAAVCGSQPSGGKGSYSDEVIENWKRTGFASFANRHFVELDLPYDFYLDRQQYDVFDYVDSLSVPALLIAGTYDDLVPSAFVAEIAEEAWNTVEFHEFPTTHYYKNDPVRLAAINEVTTTFFARHLLGT